MPTERMDKQEPRSQLIEKYVDTHYNDVSIEHRRTIAQVMARAGENAHLEIQGKRLADRVAK